VSKFDDQAYDLCGPSCSAMSDAIRAGLVSGVKQGNAGKSYVSEKQEGYCGSCSLLGVSVYLDTSWKVSTWA
jgi:hypothetical protein